MGTLVAFQSAMADDSEISDVALVAAVSTGDRAALATLYRRHHAVVYRFVARLAGVGSGDLDDLVQATFLAVHRAAARYEERASVTTWILAIAVRIVGKHVRTEVRRRGLHSRIAELRVEPPTAPDATAERRELLRRVERGLLDLPHELRAVFVLCVVEGVSGKDAAAALGMREGTLWRRLHEARTKLREAMERSQ
ncbi:MAG: RNA polymerase sigma factor [Deltaproteobacteria bacterium]|nr:RNA polymerase sigma factor [Deltaproteobacteria bacterium]